LRGNGFGHRSQPQSRTWRQGSNNALNGRRTGEVYYEIAGKRFNSSARAFDSNASFNRGQRVRVTDIKEGVFIVMDSPAAKADEI
jgi:hypothetical protein